uniref:(northern house mosquito) hypothetical protein n=1 Tax=Culex pipiens TaxID=7175 RepID=A0A8D8C834_CULPI
MTNFVSHPHFQVFTGEPTVRVTTDGLVSTTVALRLHLQSSHFAGVQMAGGGGSGTLLLRCTATVATLYDRYAELELGVPQRDPVPARGECETWPKAFPIWGFTNFFEDRKTIRVSPDEL